MGLALAGEHPWRGGRPPQPQALDNNDALALISSNALTLGQSALALDELRGLIRATQLVAALSLLAVDGSYEAYAAPVHAARPHPGSYAVATRHAPSCSARPTGPPRRSAASRTRTDSAVCRRSTGPRRTPPTPWRRSSRSRSTPPPRTR